MLSRIVSEFGHGEVDEMDISNVTVERGLDVLVEFIQGFSPWDVLITSYGAQSDAFRNIPKHGRRGAVKGKNVRLLTADATLEGLELVLANQSSHRLLEELVQAERARHSTFAGD